MACYYCDTERTCEKCLGQSEAKCPGCGVERQLAGGLWWCFTCPVPSEEPLEEQFTPKLKGPIPDSWKRLKFALEPEEAFYWRERTKQGRLRNYGDWDL